MRTSPAMRWLTCLSSTGCWFTSDEVRLLVNFVPRWIIILVMMVMYARISFILFKQSSSFESSGDTPIPRTPLEVPKPQNGPGGFPAELTVSEAAKHLGSAANEVPPTPRTPRSPGYIPRDRRRERLARLMVMYPLAYMLIWALPTFCRIYQATTKQAAPFALGTVDDVRADLPFSPPCCIAAILTLCCRPASSSKASSTP